MGYHMNMKKILVGGLAAMGMAMFSACGSSSSSSDSSDANKQTVAASVDEAAQTISIFRNFDENFCVRSENNTYTWKSIKLYNDTLVWGYKFVNDTLVIIKNPGSYYEYGMVLTGGSAGKLYGTWTMSFVCEYDDNEIDCDEESSSRDYIIQYKFGKSSVTEKRVYLDKDGEEDEEEGNFDDYMNSSFMKHFFASIYLEESFDQYVWSLSWEDSSAVTSYSLIYPVSSKTKNKMTFALNGKDVTVSVDKFIDVDDDNSSVQVSVVSGSQSCKLDYSAIYTMTSSYCKAENADYFSFDEDEDAYGYEFSYVEYYKKDNTDDFNECLDEMFFGISNAKVLNKKSVTSTVDHEKLGKLQREFYNAVKNIQK